LAYFRLSQKVFGSSGLTNIWRLSCGLLSACWIQQTKIQLVWLTNNHSQSVQPRPRYGDFSIIQDGGRRHLGFSNFGFMYSDEICFLSVRDKKLTLTF